MVRNYENNSSNTLLYTKSKSEGEKRVFTLLFFVFEGCI